MAAAQPAPSGRTTRTRVTDSARWTGRWWPPAVARSRAPAACRSTPAPV